MGQIYVRFKTDDIIRNSGQRAKSWLTRTVENSLTKILTAIVPKANPDFDGKIANVSQWILEVDEEDSIPQREIGVDDNGKVMMIMPWKDNYGFWIDSPVRIDELAKTGEMNFVDKEVFERLWTEFELKK